MIYPEDKLLALGRVMRNITVYKTHTTPQKSKQW